MRAPFRSALPRVVVVRVVTMAAGGLLMACAAKHAGELSTTSAHSTTDAHSRHHGCDRSDQDSTSVAHAPLFLVCAVDTPARLREQRLRSDFNPQLYDRACYSATLTVIVDAAGMPEPGSVHVVRYTNAAFADATVSTVPGFRFQPAVRAGTHVRQIFEWTSSLVVRRVSAVGSDVSQPMIGRAPC
jgi:hypothetical protein